MVNPSSHFDSQNLERFDSNPFKQRTQEDHQQVGPGACFWMGRNPTTVPCLRDLVIVAVGSCDVEQWPRYVIDFSGTK
jgi:hypothetical protein